MDTLKKEEFDTNLTNDTNINTYIAKKIVREVCVVRAYKFALISASLAYYANFHPVRVAPLWRHFFQKLSPKNGICLKKVIHLSVEGDLFSSGHPPTKGVSP
jgi:hypothetical protein